MGKFNTTYEEAKLQFPKEVAEVEQNIRKSKGRCREDDLETFDWSYRWGTVVKGNSFQELINGTAQVEQQDWNAMTVDEQVADVIARSSFSLEAKKGRSRYSVELTKCPTEIEDFYRTDYQQMKDDQERFNNLSSDEQRAETERLLKELGQYGGFAAVTLKSR